MNIHAGVDPHLLTQAANHVHQLADPYTIPIRTTHPTTRRTQWHAITHPPLLQQLMNNSNPATTPPGPERHRIPDSRPPANLDAINTLHDILTGIDTWRHNTGSWRTPIPRHSTLAWARAALRGLTGLMPNLAPSLAEQLAHDIHTWWRAAAIHSGWRPTDLQAR